MILVLILASVTLAAVAQIALKFGMNEVGSLGRAELRAPLSTAARIASTPAIWLGFLMFGLSAVFWVIVLSRVDLSFAYPFAALTYVIILVFDRLVLHLPVSPLRWAGVGLILAGIVLVSRTHG